MLNSPHRQTLHLKPQESYTGDKNTKQTPKCNYRQSHVGAG